MIGKNDEKKLRNKIDIEVTDQCFSSKLKSIQPLHNLTSDETINDSSLTVH